MNLLAWLGITKADQPLEVGDPAPNAVARDEQNREVRLTDLYGDGFALVYFYPKADTPGCTAQACSLRDAFTELKERGVRVIGVSADNSSSQLRFKEKHRLPFTLIADPDHRVAKAFHVPLMLGLTRRQSFLIRGGRVVWRDLSASTGEQANDALKALKKLN